MKTLIITLVMLLCINPVAWCCAKVMLVNNTDKVVVGLVNGDLNGERTSFMGGELDPAEEFSGSCYPVGDYDVIWIVPGQPNIHKKFSISDDDSEVVLSVDAE